MIAISKQINKYRNKPYLLCSAFTSSQFCQIYKELQHADVCCKYDHILFHQISKSIIIKCYNNRRSKKGSSESLGCDSWDQRRILMFPDQRQAAVVAFILLRVLRSTYISERCQANLLFIMRQREFLCLR